MREGRVEAGIHTRTAEGGREGGRKGEECAAGCT